MNPPGPGPAWRNERTAATALQTSTGFRGLDGKTPIVTGAASGIGRAIAARLCEEGAIVAVFDRDDVAGAKVAAELARRGGRASAHAVDITDRDAVEAEEVVRVRSR